METFSFNQVRSAALCLVFSLALTVCGQSCSQHKQTSTPMKFLHVKKGKLEYRVQGTGEPVLLIHGSAIADTFLILMREPALANYQLIQYHRRNFAGSSHAPDPFNLSDQAQDAADVLRHLGIKKAHIVGHSYGAATTLQLTLDFPDLVHSLVVMEPPGITLPGDPPSLAGVFAALATYEEGKPEEAIDAFLKYAVGENWEVECERTTPGGPAQAKRDARSLFEVEIPALKRWQFGEQEAKRITQPMLFMMGSRSIPALTASKPFLESWIPQLETHTVEGVDHSLHAQKPKEFAEKIADFLKRNPLLIRIGKSPEEA